MFLEPKPARIWSTQDQDNTARRERNAVNAQLLSAQLQIPHNRAPMIVMEGDDVELGDQDEFYSVLSHISSEEETPAEAPSKNLPRGTSVEGNDPAETQLYPEAVTCELSEEEDKKLNAKIDQLLAAVQQGRPLHFNPNADNGEIDMFADPPNVASNGVRSLEEDIAASGPSFGNIVEHDDRQQWVRSVNSPISIKSVVTSPTEVLSQDCANAWDQAVAEATARLKKTSSGSFEDWETVSSTDSARSQISTCPPAPRGVDVNRRLRRQEIAAGEPRGRRFGRLLDPNVVEVYPDNYPLPLNYNTRPRSRTPSVESADSVVDFSSPLFSKSSYADLLRMVTPPVSEKSDEHLGANESVLDWLEELELPQPVEVPKNKKGKAAFGVFKDQLEPRKGEATIAAPQILKNVFNLRQPGYLTHNSFAQARGKAKALETHRSSSTGILPAQSLRKDKGRGEGVEMEGVSSTDMRSAQSFGGVTNAEGRRPNIKSKWPELLTHQAEKPTTVAQNPAHQHPISHTPLNPDALSQNPERAAHFEDALARLEGRAPAETSLASRRLGGLHREDTAHERHKKGL